MAKFKINWDLIKDIIFGIFTLGVWFLLKPKPGQRKSVVKEWIDAIIFAVIAATIIRTFFIEAYTIPTGSMEKSLLVGDFLFVSKVSYGARIPMTPLSFPFAHHTMPIVGGKSYLEWIKAGYYRLPGFGHIKHGDCVVFNWPAENEGRPVDKKENYIKRCIGISGDIIELKERAVYINEKAIPFPEFAQSSYHVITDGTGFSEQAVQRLGLRDSEPLSPFEYNLHLSEQNANDLRSFGNVKQIIVNQSKIKDSPWWDNLSTKNKIENRQETFKKSFKDAISSLEKQLGTDVESWTWSRVHKLEIKHPLSSVALLKPIFGIGTFDIAGSNEVINNNLFTYTDDAILTVKGGPSTRRIIDFSDVENSLSILPSGNSGNPFSKHYDDQAKMFVDGKFRKMKLNKLEIIKTSTKLVFKPKN